MPGPTRTEARRRIRRSDVLRRIVTCRRAWIVLGLTVAAAGASPSGFEPRPKAAAGLAVVVKDDFERDVIGPWEPTDPAAWRIAKVGEGRVLEQHKASEYEPP